MNLTKMLVSHTLSRFVSFYQGCPRTLRTTLVLSMEFRNNLVKQLLTAEIG